MLLDDPNILNDFRKRSPAYGSIFSSIWKALLILSEDPHCEVKSFAEIVIDYVMVNLNHSELGLIVKEMQGYLLSKSTLSISEGFISGTPIVSKFLGEKRQVSSASVINRKNNLLINGSSLKTRAVSSNDHSTDSDSESITSKIKNLSMAKLLKSFHINEESDIKGFGRILNSGLLPSRYGAEYKPKSAFYRPRDLTEWPELPAESDFLSTAVNTFKSLKCQRTRPMNLVQRNMLEDCGEGIEMK